MSLGIFKSNQHSNRFICIQVSLKHKMFLYEPSKCFYIPFFSNQLKICGSLDICKRSQLKPVFFPHSFYLLVSDCIKETGKYIANGFDIKIISYNGF